MLKFEDHPNLNLDLDQSRSRLNGCAIVGEIPLSYSLTPDDNSFMVQGEKEKPEPRSSGSKTALTESIVPSIIADPDLPARDKQSFSIGAAMSANNGYVKLMRRALDLLEEDPQAFLLISLIALRARWKEKAFNRNGLKIGQALIGDHNTVGLTRQQYRLVMRRLTHGKIATFQGTNKGTIATILDSTIYDINSPSVEPSSEPTKNQQRTNQEPLTKKVRKKERKEKEKRKEPQAALSPSEDARRLASVFFQSIKSWLPSLKDPNMPKWQREIDLMIRRDNRSVAEIQSVIDFLPGSFYGKNVLSAAKLREKFDQITAYMLENKLAEKPKNRLSELVAKIPKDYSVSNAYGKIEIFSSLGYSVGVFGSDDFGGIENWLKNKRFV